MNCLPTNWDFASVLLSSLSYLVGADMTELVWVVHCPGARPGQGQLIFPGPDPDPNYK